MLAAFLVSVALLLGGDPEPGSVTRPAPTRGSAQSITVLMHQAAEQRRSGDYAGAAETYRVVLKRAPSLYEAHLFLADTLRRRRLDAQAEAEFLIALRLRPADPLPYVSLADLRREAFRFEEAQQFLEQGMIAVKPEQREPLLVARGTILRQSGDPAGAAALMEEAARQYPASTRVREVLGRSAMDLGKVEEAMQAFAAGLEASPGLPSLTEELHEARDLLDRLRSAEAGTKAPNPGAAAWGSLARLRLQARQYPLAAAAAAEGLKRDKSQSGLLLLQGIALERSGKSSEAAGALKRIRPEAPEYLLAQYHRAYLARIQGDDAAEEKIWAEAARSHPEDSASCLMLILCWKRSGILEAKLESLHRRNGSAKPSEADLLLEGMALEELGRAEEAAKIYATLFLSDPADPESLARLSGLMARTPPLLQAWLKMEGEAEVLGHPGAAAQALLRACLLETAGWRDAATETLRAAAKSSPEDGDIALALSIRLEAQAGGEKDAALYLEKALQLEPASAWPRLQKGLAQLRAGDAKGALAQAEQAKSQAPDRVEAWQLAGSARRMAGDYSGAIQDFSRSLLMDPADSLGVARFQLALAYSASGDFVAARQALEGDLPQFPELIYRLAWSFAGRNFLDRTFHGEDWVAQRDHFADPRAAPAQAYAAVAALLASLGDPYTRLRPVDETESIYLRARSEALQTDRSGVPTTASSAFVTGNLGGDIGYLRLTSFSDPSAREAIRKALERMAESQGLVLDLRGNAGGLASEADAIAGMLMEEGETLGVQRSASGEEIQKVPQTRPVYSRKPLVVLTDRRTGSAAEKLAAGLQGSGRATVLGEGTFGKGAAQMSRLLPGGPMALVTAAENLAPGGAPIQGRGVVPDVPAEEDESLEKAKEILQKPTP